jgi:hypothetical protein
MSRNILIQMNKVQSELKKENRILKNMLKKRVSRRKYDKDFIYDFDSDLESDSDSNSDSDYLPSDNKSDSDNESDNESVKYVSTNKKEKKNQKYDLDTIFDFDLKYSSIEMCSINKKLLKRLSYRSILIHILKSMTRQNILKHFSFNYSKKDMNGIGGYYWCKDIELSFQGKSSHETLKEIIRLCNINGYKIVIKVNLDSGESITYNN